MTLGDLDRARSLFAEAGLPFPLIPEEFVSAFRQVGEWQFATCDLETWPYRFREYVQRATDGPVPNSVVIAHAGHGVNSYAIHYYVLQKPLYLFVQIGWGGVYMNGDEAVADLKRCFNLSARLLASMPKGIRAGRVSGDDRLIVAASDFYGSSVECVSSAPERRVQERFHRPWYPIEAAIRLVEAA